MSGPTMAGSKTQPLAKCQLSRAPRMVLSMLVISFMRSENIIESSVSSLNAAKLAIIHEFETEGASQHGDSLQVGVREIQLSQKSPVFQNACFQPASNQADQVRLTVTPNETSCFSVCSLCRR